jgi:hypothetical protein
MEDRLQDFRRQAALLGAAANFAHQLVKRTVRLHGIAQAQTEQ